MDLFDLWPTGTCEPRVPTHTHRARTSHFPRERLDGLPRHRTIKRPPAGEGGGRSGQTARALAVLLHGRLARVRFIRPSQLHQELAARPSQETTSLTEDGCCPHTQH